MYHRLDLDEPRLVSAPIPIRFAGWESTTYQLQQNGWQLSAMERRYEDTPRPTLTLALQHPDLQIRAMTRPIEVDYLALARGDSVLQALCATGLNIQAFGSTLILNVMHQGLVDFRPVDAQPMYERIERMNIDDFKIFADAQLVRTEEVQA